MTGAPTMPSLQHYGSTDYRFFSKVHRRPLENKKMNPIRIFLDLTKDYGVLNHKILLSKLLRY
jgi:hypothetical protein